MPSEVHRAVRTFAGREGRGWKRKLCDMWERSEYPGHADITPLLQQARNTLGPSGLDRLAVHKEAGTDVPDSP